MDKIEFVGEVFDIRILREKDRIYIDLPSDGRIVTVSEAMTIAGLLLEAGRRALGPQVSELSVSSSDAKSGKDRYVRVTP